MGSNKMKTVIIDTNRDCYEITQCSNTLTARELIEILENFDPDAPVVFRNDNGYTYGSLSEDGIACIDTD